jgi:UDP-N-acetylmuramoyl-L-alanyl-D-glutamate--2,6-diaminopimelate ligase/murE/murF fusion protein
MRLARLMTALVPAAVTGLQGQGPEVTGLHYRAQEVQPGGIFVAIRGHAADGHDYIDDARQRGAVAVVTEKPVAGAGVVVTVGDTRRALAELAAAFYGHPSEQLTVIAVTGTNGKTTTTYLVEGILTQAGLPTGVIGTINYRHSGRSHPSPVTTPESLDLQRILAEMRAAGVSHVVLEASSHAIELQRIHACWLDVGVFTNLSQDHLDFHGCMPAYWAAKKRLFTHFLRSGPKAGRAVAVVNTDNDHGRTLAEEVAHRIIRTGTRADCSVRGELFACDHRGLRAAVRIGDRHIAIHSQLVGRHNIENLLCAAGVGAALGIAPQVIGAGIEAVRCVPGRLERVESRSGRWVYVDYAHTPDALEHALSALRALTAGRVICVFGCGGDRDRTKRPVMGAIAARLSDLAIVTSDNPRTEDPVSILAQIVPGMQAQGVPQVDGDDIAVLAARKSFVAEPDRRKAIALGLRAAQPGDTVLIAGKGHEPYQIIGRQVIHFDDREEAASVLKKLEEGNEGRSDGSEG